MTALQISVGLALLLANEIAAAEYPPLPEIFNEVRQLSGSTTTHQNNANAQQREALRSMGFGAKELAPVLVLQEEALQRQAEADQAVSDSAGLYEKITKVHSEAHKAAERLRQSQRDAEEIRLAIASAKEEVEKSGAHLRNVEVRWELAHKSVAGKSGDERNAVLVPLRRERDEASHKATQAKIRLAEFERRLPRTQQTQADTVAFYNRQTDMLRDFAKRLASQASAAESKQQTALLAQEKAYQALVELVEKQGKSETKTPAATAGAEVKLAENASQPEVPRNAGASELLGAARQIERDIAGRYREIRAAELAQIRSIPLSEAREQTDVPLPERPAAQAAVLDSQPRTPAQLQKYNEEMSNAIATADSMVDFAQQLYQTVLGEEETADSSDSSGNGGVPGGASAGFTSLSGGGSAAVAVGSSLEALAADEAGSDAKDLTRLMRAGYARLNPFEAEGILKKDFRPGYVAPGEIGNMEEMLSAAPGRRVAQNLSGQRWLYVSDWYMIGPFPNADRRNLHRQFPPETVIDLDAIYEGAGGQEVRWKFTQMGVPVMQFRESYTVYYAYTEIWSDVERDLWIAAGADDTGRLWINDFLVWKAVDEPKPWRINEAYRKVTFRKGINRVLYRIENGPAYGWFSLLLHTASSE